MINPTPKQLTVQSLINLRKARTKALMRIKCLRQGASEAAHTRALKELKAIEAKMQWEINTNGKRLKDRE